MKRIIYHIRWHVPYFQCRDELSVTYGIVFHGERYGLVFHGERVVTPTDLQQMVKERVHSSHLGIEGCLRRARECLFWPNMNADLKAYISACSICRSRETSQQRETLVHHGVPDRPWAKVGTDLFSISDTSYLIVVDYYTKFWNSERGFRTATKILVYKAVILTTLLYGWET